MNIAKSTKSQIKSAVTMYEYSIRDLREVLQAGTAPFEDDIERKVRRLNIADLNSLIKLDAENAGHSLCCEQMS